MIKLVMGRLLQIVQVDPKSNHRCPYKRKAERDGTQRGEGNVKMGAEIGVMQPQAKECSQLPEGGRGKKQVLP